MSVAGASNERIDPSASERRALDSYELSPMPLVTPEVGLSDPLVVFVVAVLFDFVSVEGVEMVSLTRRDELET